ncbi:flagellar motor protein MotB [Pseudoxanthomonas wuyuanensis]|uniref:Chemotaxis protein MotB n=1 Tax=Pseudoxanthomonas wuyuanensis TaxID=1073196 RepID=A0A286DB87_9GAMM|nr:flagellar motor protein MotB [Pseudoxanthomonas wuyuanensis]KAF1721769.1 motility protein MotB [Pseudoxanthomonas wuyuanensis]SOD55925.1 chemotaxis protein MotB [Pseudoxanthomonas wuyuanensis]
MADKPTVVVVRRVRKVAGGGHHGGAWKVAFADFVTAMMAFFLVMWLVAATSRQERAAISEYFRNPSPVAGKNMTPATGALGPGGASTSMIALGGTMDIPRGSGEDPHGKAGAAASDAADDSRALESLMQALEEAISKSQALEPFKDQLLLDLTPEGLRIQIVDKHNRPMFDLGSAALKPYTSEILHELAGFVGQVPNTISITGHTDISHYTGKRGYSNWELSADRANAARRALVDGGLQEDRVSRVVGLSSSVLFDKSNPANPINRRISIVVMTHAAADAITQDGLPLALGPSLADADVQMPPAAALPVNPSGAMPPP